MTHALPDVRLAVGLAAVAGFVDAVGFISVGGWFVSFMTGNSTQAAVAVVDGEFANFFLAAGLVACFVVGVVLGSVVGDRAGMRRRSAVLLLVAVMLTTAAVAYPVTGVMVPSALLLAAAMGAENAVFERDGEVSIGLTYMTGTLVKMSQNIAARLQGRGERSWPRYLSLWSALCVGAFLGALAYSAVHFWSVVIAIGVVGASAVGVRVSGR